MRVDLSFTKDPAFHFEENGHRYFYGDRELSSVSSVIRGLKAPFDRDRIARRVARREGRSVRAVLGEWEAKRNLASRRGEIIHDCVQEHLVTGLMPSPPPDLDPDDEWDVRRRLQEYEAWHARHLAGVTALGAELRVWSLALGIAGTLDVLALRDDNVYVGDWKTNGKFNGLEARAYENLRGPLAHLPDVHLTSYSMQVSLYRILLREHGIRTAGGFIVHLPEDAPPRLWHALDLRRELWEYLTVWQRWV